MFAAVVRAVLPESAYFLRSKAAGELGTSEKNKTFFKETGRAVKTHWVRCIYAVLLMTGFK